MDTYIKVKDTNIELKFQDKDLVSIKELIEYIEELEEELKRVMSKQDWEEWY